mmetsp:Transcript_64218/g.129084  ORF Transcript_64218/g.129084 Transcript_64218/m.129084 type:complete len:99 (-) Transcript_64218:89-385(-)
MEGPRMHLEKMWCATCESTALKQSSNRYTSASAYTARAMATRCFCPPDRLMPFSPISVWSPSGSCCKSDVSAHASITEAYLSWLNGFPKRTLSLSVAF